MAVNLIGRHRTQYRIRKESTGRSCRKSRFFGELGGKATIGDWDLNSATGIWKEYVLRVYVQFVEYRFCIRVSYRTWRYCYTRWKRSKPTSPVLGIRVLKNKHMDTWVKSESRRKITQSHCSRVKQLAFYGRSILQNRARGFVCLVYYMTTSMLLEI